MTYPNYPSHNSKLPVTDAEHSSPEALEERAGVTGRMLLKVIDKAVHMQSGVIENYVDWLRNRNPDASPAEIQKKLDAHFKYVATGTGASVGAASAIPGIGFVTGAAAIGVESLVFTDAAAVYTMASAYLRGIDIRDPERRRTLILVVATGAAGTMLVDAAIGDLSRKNGASIAAALSRYGTPQLKDVNNRLLSMALKRLGKKFRGMWIGKIMPFGIGAALGTWANRKIASKVISNTAESLGPLPATFSTPAPKNVEAPNLAEINTPDK
ncbi:hypothetical protein [Corynebacterium freiburgense]|uniref:hypothetical protein n=1 Tax=Corynebacterium freiburgense TaxID=556548 RepID=UPI000416FE57|nr:hypothetical protein [Corynebacterium freiburgense]WJZ02305.1 hypothetical protein CFREI_05045 [Corynebacterium freiburgense]